MSQALQEFAAARLPRRVEKFLRGRAFDDLPVIHEGDAIADVACEGELVGR